MVIDNFGGISNNNETPIEPEKKAETPNNTTNIEQTPSENKLNYFKEIPLSDNQKERLNKILLSENFSIREIKNDIKGKTPEEIDNYLLLLEEEINDSTEINIYTNSRLDIETNNKIIDNNNNGKENEIHIKRIVSNLESIYPGISNDFGPKEDDKEKITQKKSELENNPIIKGKLESSGIDIDTYINYSITRDNIQNKFKNNIQDEKLKQFVENVNTLEDILGIPRLTAKGYPLSYNEQLTTTGSEILKKDTRIQSIEQETKIGEGISTLEECLSLAKLYGFKGEYNENDLKDLVGKPVLTNEETQAIEKFISSEEMKILKEKHNERIKNYTQGYAAQTPIFSLINYLDHSSKTSEETLANKLSQNNGTKTLNNDWATIGENGELEIKGFIDGNPITLYYDINGEHNNLKCDDFLHIENELITLNNEKYGKTELKINMPTMNDIVDNIKDIPYNEILNNSKDLNEYQKTISEALMKKTKNLFPENNEAKRRLNKNIEKNLTTQEICSTLIPKKFQNKISENLKNTTNMTSLRRMLTTIDNTTEHSSLARIKEFKQQFKTINVFLNEYINNTSNEDDVTNPINKIKDPLIKQYIENIKKTLNNENYSEENYIQRENNMCKFFSIFSTEQSGNFGNLLNINSLESFTKHLNNGQTLNETDLGCFSTNFQEEHIQILAEENFDTSLKEMS